LLHNEMATQPQKCHDLARNIWFPRTEGEIGRQECSFSRGNVEIVSDYIS